MFKTKSLLNKIIVANKMDILEAKENLEKFKAEIAKDNPPLVTDDGEEHYNYTIVPISAYTRDNLDELLFKVADALETISIDAFEEKFVDEVVEYKFQKTPDPFTITQGDDGIYEVEGPMIQKYFDSTDFSHEENVKLFARRIRNLGVDEQLRKLGVQNGDTVRILGYEFEFFD